MCDIWNNPTKREEEFAPALLEKLPEMDFANITGGEPFAREDLPEIVSILKRKAKRIVISTSGWLEDRVLALAADNPDIGIRVSIEGLSQKNDELRGQPGGFDRGLRLLLGLRKLGVRDIGFGITVSDSNSRDMLWLYELAKNLNMEFATAAFHNSFYFQKFNNRISNTEKVRADFQEVANRLIRERHPKSWFRALFNVGLINYVSCGKRMLPCEAGTENFFIDPSGEVLPCNGMEPDIWFQSMGNLHDVTDFMEIWDSPQANEVREKVRKCPKNCWMVGTAAPVMKKYIRHVLPWVVRTKMRSLIGRELDGTCCPHFNVGQNPTQGGTKRNEDED
jgi:radical SAM protein with 4Fe4S-binding SPASM domain